jgi:hypothetical protein
LRARLVDQVLRNASIEHQDEAVAQSVV